MNKNKDKHHPPEEAKKHAKAEEPATTDGDEPKAAPAEADHGPAADEAAPLQHDKPKAEQEIIKLKDQLLRLQADFDNFRKRSLREKGEIYENANEALMLDLLPVIDHLQLAIKSAKEHAADGAFQEGLQLISDQLMDVLAKYGLVLFDSEKQPFDPTLHEAISCLPSETEPEGKILAQSRQGYRFKNKLLRPAQVVVSGGKPVPPAEKKENSNNQTSNPK